MNVQALQYQQMGPRRVLPMVQIEEPIGMQDHRTLLLYQVGAEEEMANPSRRLQRALNEMMHPGALAWEEAL